VAGLWALLLVEAVVVVVVMRPWLEPDSRAYLALSRNLLDGRYGTFRDGAFAPELFHPPGYPVYLMVLLRLVRLPAAAVVASQMALLLASVALLQRLLVRHGLSPLPFLVIVAVTPATMGYAAKLMSEGPAIFVVACLTYLLAAPGRFGTGRVVGVALLAGGSIMLRPSLILLPVVVAAGVALVRLRAEPGRRPALAAGAVLVLAGVTLVPYTAVNYRQVDRATPLPPAAAIGYTVYASTFEPAEVDAGRKADEGELPAGSGREYAAERARINDRIEARASGSGEPATVSRELAGSEVYQDAAWRRVRDDPVGYARQVAFNWWRLWNTAEFPDGTPGVVRLGLQAANAAVWALGLAGVAWVVVRSLRRRLAPGWAAAGLVLLYFPAVHAFMISTARYTAPARLVLDLFAAVLALELLARYRARRGGGAPATLGSRAPAGG